MRKTTLLVITLLVTNLTFGQKTESILSLNSGLFSFNGPSSQPTSHFNVSPDKKGYTNNPFGAKNGLSYGLSYQIQRVSSRNFIIGIGIGYENLRSRTIIDGINGFDNTGTYQETATGHTNLANQFINGHPYLGYRFATAGISIDLTGGLDVGYLLSSQEIGNATAANGETYTTSIDRKSISVDVRPRVQLSAFYGKTGAYMGYSHGLANYRQGWVGGVNQCNAELIRFGLIYKLSR